MDWHTKAIELYSQGMTIADIHKQMQRDGYNATYDAVKKTIYRHKDKNLGEKQGKEEQNSTAASGGRREKSVL
jgi:hypothetical protein